MLGASGTGSISRNTAAGMRLSLDPAQESRSNLGRPGRPRVKEHRGPLQRSTEVWLAHTEASVRPFGGKGTLIGSLDALIAGRAVALDLVLVENQPRGVLSVTRAKGRRLDEHLKPQGVTYPKRSAIEDSDGSLGVSPVVARY